ncbi:MAG: hypothetical protein QOD71_2423 [Thermoleophilaceae bacterium]|jgi:hypothetical protein|nr:hypothetical protein [Thermoleophilaceae bacterium]
MYPHGGISGAALASAVPTTEHEGAALKKPTAASLAIAAVLLAVPAANAQATLTVDPVAPCYREQSIVRLPGSGFTPNAPVVFSRDGSPIGDPIPADASGALLAQLRLPGLVSGQRRLTYVATDSTNPALTTQVSLLVTATDVGLRPEGGPPNRLLTIRARGFFGGDTLYAHVVRTGRRPGRARNLRIGPVKGACKQVEARKRLFSRGTPPGKYRIQFDTFRRYKPKRAVETEFIVTVFEMAGKPRASKLSPAS